MKTLVVVGASVAGVAAVESVRAAGFDGRLVLADGDERRPHDRPALSKEVLTGDLDEEDLALLSPQRERDLGVELHLGTRAHDLDLDRSVVGIGDEAIRFDGLVVATGARARLPRPLAGPAGVLTLRSMGDALEIARTMRDGQPRVAVIGGGFIGCEVAAAARHHGLDVTIVEAAPRLLARALHPDLARPLARRHQDAGVELRCGIPVRGVAGTGQVTGVLLEDSTVVPADLVVVGVGSEPATDWLAGSGLHCADGVVTDAALRTAAARVFAAGDIARRLPTGPAASLADAVRTEHWTDARRQGTLAGRNAVTGEGTAYTEIPYVWSDQYGARLQLAGRCSGELRFVSGGPDTDSYVALVGVAGVVAGAVAFGDATGFLRARRLVTRHQPWHDRIADDWLAA